MRYRVLQCASGTCKAFIGDKCGWRQKVLTCEKNELSDIYQHGRHLTDVASPRKPKLTREMKAYAEPLIYLRMKPNRIYNNVLDHFGHKEGESPVLRQVQTFIGHFRRSALNETDFVDDMVKLVNRTQFTVDMQDGAAFTFGYATNADGSPAIGEGLDDDPTIVGISAPYMMKMLRYAASYVFHIDTTNKLDLSGYPVLVVGVSDRSRSFHPVALFVMSQQTGELIGNALHSLFDKYKAITGEFPTIRYCMGDADKAQFNAIVEITTSKHPDNGPLLYLMCFFHVVKNVADRVSSLSVEAVSLGFKHLYQMHYSKDSTEFTAKAEQALATWTAIPVLKSFAVYFKKQWIDSQFSNWGCYHTPTGFEKTNNPVEQFNNVIKRDYSLRTLLKLVALAD
ncbi:hypothetical protein PC129_g8252 [Phytophthora cactorum]|uniref:MULE transposase domain-containing protein n=3 Tax=Phytophthora cactorum TaxID=29920 RepID=A0A8T1I7C2_9STRA|nr:hypothetical protein PC129_g8252 [Phytophthora cactorum]